MVTRKVLSLVLVVRIYRPQPSVEIDLRQEKRFCRKGVRELKKKQLCLLKRFAALVAALMLSFALAVPCFASEASMPSDDDFLSHPFSWYVWRTSDLHDGYSRYELISSPISLSGSLLSGSGFSYSFSVNTRRFDSDDNSGDFYTYGFPSLAEPRGVCGSWSYYPSFPIGSRRFPYALFRVYTDSSEFQSYYGSVCPSPESFYLNSYSDTVSGFGAVPPASFSQWIYPTVRGPYTTGNTHANNWVIFSGLDNAVVMDSSSANGRVFGPKYCPVVTSGYINWGVSGWSDFSSHFPDAYSFPSSDARFWLVNPSDVTGSFSGTFACSLVVPSFLLPSDVEVGDWISQGTMDKLQDQLVNEFDVNSDTLKSSKDNLNSWNSTSSVDSDVASGASGLLGGLFQNLGTFLFSVSLLCFGAVVLRMLIRKAVDG